MCSIPHYFYAQELKHQNIKLPSSGLYATGMIYLNPSAAKREISKKTFENVALSLGLFVLYWRACPRNALAVGPNAASKEPVIEQPFIEPVQSMDDVAFDAAVFILRKQVTHEISMESGFYICSLSRRTIVYKGMLSPCQLYQYFLGLKRPDFQAHFAVVHSRFSTNTFPSWDRAQPMRIVAHNGFS